MDQDIPPINHHPQKPPVLKRVIILLAFLLTLFAAGTYYVINHSTKQVKVSLTSAPAIIQGKMVTLKQLTENHILDYHNMFSDIVRKNLEFPEIITLGYTISFLKIEIERSRQGKQLAYSIFDNKDNVLIGAIEIMKEDTPETPGQLACWINENYWGGGRSQEAIKLLSRTFFSLMQDTKSYIAHVRLWNQRSYKALKKAGLRDVGFFYEDGKPSRYLLEMRREDLLGK